MEGVDMMLFFAFGLGIVSLLVLILVFRLNAFISLLIASIVVGIIAGLDFPLIIQTVVDGMGGTLGFVAIVVGLGAIFGEILRISGSTEKLAAAILKAFGEGRAPAALSIIGFLIAIPVFFDVAFILLVPVLYGLQRKTNRSLLFYAIPLLAGLAVTHAFIPPTPGPIAVADIIGAELGWIILLGMCVGIPTTIAAGLLFGRFIGRRIDIKAPTLEPSESKVMPDPPLGLILGLIALPIVLIVGNTVSKALYPDGSYLVVDVLQFAGHPIVALIVSTVLALYLLGTRYGFSKDQLQEISMKALGPAGIIILITGAGGVFKSMLIETGAGSMLAEQFASVSVSPIVVGFVIALLIRLIQGSATVAMITAAGIMAPIIESIELSNPQLALVVLSIAAGASGFSHVNDSGFWLVNRYLGLTEKETLKSWTIMTGILSVTALVIISMISILL